MQVLSCLARMFPSGLSIISDQRLLLEVNAKEQESQIALKRFSSMLTRVVTLSHSLAHPVNSPVLPTISISVISVDLSAVADQR